MAEGPTFRSGSEEKKGAYALFPGDVGRNPSARGNGLDLEKEVKGEPWCLSPNKLESWYHDVKKNMKLGTKQFEVICTSEIEYVVTTIRNSTRHMDTLGFTDRVVKGGSFGKGTMVKDLSDVDLVLFVDKPQLQPITETGNLNEYESALKDITSHLEKNVKNARDINRYPYGVNFKKNVSDRWVEFNLLPTTEENVQHFLHTNRNTFLSMLDVEPETRAFYSASFVEHQMHFVGDQDGNVKELIRLVKYWASRFLPDKLQKSYPLELITIDRWVKAGRPRLLDKATGLKSVLKVLTKLDSLCVYWNYMPGVDEQLNETIIRKLDMKRPIILDPANPTNNVGDLYQKNDNKEVIEAAAEKTLRTTLLSEVRGMWPIKERPQ